MTCHNTKWNEKPSVKIRGNRTFKNSERENNSEAEKVGRKDSVIFDTNNNNSNKPIPSTYTNIGSIHNSADIRVIENILKSVINLVHTPPAVPASQILFMG